MSQLINFSDLQIASTTSTADQLLLRLNNSLSGASGFARVTALNFQNSLPLYTAYQSTSGLAITNITVSSPISSTGGKTPALSISPASTASGGYMTSADKIKLNTIALSASVSPYTSGTGLSSIKPIFGANIAKGNYASVLCGFSNTASGNNTIVAGYNSVAVGPDGITIGYNNYSDSGFVFGSDCGATAGGVSIGSLNSANAAGAIAIGAENTANVINSVAIGTLNTVNASYAWAIGSELTNSVNNSMMIGPDVNTNITIRGNNGRIGLDTTTPISKFQIVNGTLSVPTADISTNTTLTADSKYLQNYTGTGGHTITLPACSSGNGLTFVIKNVGSGSAITVSRAGSDTIFNATSVTSVSLAVGASLTVTVRSSSQWSAY